MRTLANLQAAWAMALAGALGWGLHAGHGSAPAVTGRMISSLLLVAAAALAWHFSRSRLMGWVLAGIAFGALGDFANAGLLGPASGTLAAMGAFGLGHLCYVAGILGVLRRQRPAMVPTMTGVGVWLAAGVLGWYVVVWQAPPSSLDGLVWPALGYTLLLSATAGFATALALALWSFRLLAVGAALFLLSDLILAVRLFRGAFPWDTLAVWVPYGVGQMLIVFTAVRATVPPLDLRKPA